MAKLAPVHVSERPEAPALWECSLASPNRIARQFSYDGFLFGSRGTTRQYSVAYTAVKKQ